MALLTKIGYGQVEPNHLSAQRTGQIYAQLPAAAALTVVENGMMVKYDYVNGEVNTTGDGEWMLVYNEVKLYDKARQGYKDFALKASEAVDAVITPRVFKVNNGDIFTTNLIDTTVLNTVTVGTILVPAAGVLTEAVPAVGDEVYHVVKVTTMPDGQAAVKVQKIGVKVTV